MRAMSVRENAKSNRHRKTHRVEPDGTGRMFTHLTRGDLRRESGGGVSSGRSSEESRRKAAGAKGQRTKRERSTDRLDQGGEQDDETTGRSNCGSHPVGGREERRWSPPPDLYASSESTGSAWEGESRRCSRK
jgi:hypothetical protein